MKTGELATRMGRSIVGRGSVPLALGRRDVFKETKNLMDNTQDEQVPLALGRRDVFKSGFAICAGGFCHWD